MMRGERVFVTGGAGVIGCELVPRLVSAGAHVLVGDLKPRPQHFPVEVLYRQGDLNHMQPWEWDEFAPTVLIHLAATFERSNECWEFWEESFQHNVRLSHHLMTAARDVPSLHRVVFASSYLVYDRALYEFDEPQHAPRMLRESDPIRPRNLTGMAKLSHEMELRFLSAFLSERISIACARIYRGYGRNSRCVISRWVRAALKGEELIVYRPEGMFDYIYAADSAEGLLRLAARRDVTGVLNLGSGCSRPVQHVLDVLQTHFPQLRALAMDSDIPWEASCADMEHWRRTMAWVPAYDLETAIPEIIAFERERAEAPEPRTPVILISSSASKVPLVRAVMDAAARLHPGARVLTGDLDPQVPTRWIGHDFWHMPPTRDESFAEILQGCVDRGIRLVVPTRDAELLFWARHRDRLQAAGVDVVVASYDAVNRCLDKLSFAGFGQTTGMPVIPAYLQPEGEGPWAVKERWGSGSRSIGLRLDPAQALAHAATLEHPIFQPWVQGQEISGDAWLDGRSRCKALVLRTRDRVVNGESYQTTTFHDPGLEARLTRVLEGLGLTGPVVLQAVLDNGRQPHIIEVNPRFGGASTAGIAAGLDSWYWSLAEWAGIDVETLPMHLSQEPVRQIRVPSDVVLRGHRL